MVDFIGEMSYHNKGHYIKLEQINTIKIQCSEIQTLLKIFIVSSYLSHYFHLKMTVSTKLVGIIFLNTLQNRGFLNV